MAAGLRVVRGPDWNQGDKDGGEGHIGTVVKDNGNHTYTVVWDMGGSTVCKTGSNGKYELRILDNAPIGARHEVNCSVCKKKTLGIRWQCAMCSSESLCTACYVLDKHNLQHPFKRFDDQGSVGIDVNKRSTSTKLHARGIFPGAKVERGPDWDFGDQDGGPGSKGEIIDIRGYGADKGSRNAVKVKWGHGESNVYRVGCKGKVDIKCLADAAGFDYYRDHLPIAGKKETPAVKPKEKNAPAPADEVSDTVLKEGDRVCVHLPVEALKEVQKGHGGWSMRMSECIGETMTIKRFLDPSTVEVDHNGKKWIFYLGALSKIYPFKVGDIVKVINDEKRVQLLQQNHGGWDDEMKKSLDKVGRVVKIDSDGDVAVAFGQSSWVYNPGCLVPAPGATETKLNTKQQDFSASTGRAAEDLGANLGRLMAHLLVLDALAGTRVSVGPEEIVVNAARGNVANVTKILQMKPELANATFQNLTPLMAASHEGHLEVVKILIEKGARIEAKDPKGSTSLLLAIAGKEEAVAQYLVQKGADVKIVGAGGRTTAHVSAYEGMCNILKLVLEKGCSPNNQDVDGDTPLHDAIAKGNDRAVALILSHPNINLRVANKQGFNLLQWAAFKGHDFAVERMLTKPENLQLVDVKKADGHTALHIAAVNNHCEIAAMLLKGGATVDIQNGQRLTPLHLAAHEGYYDMVKLLMEKGANLSVKDNDGDTPLHVALMGGRSNAEADLFLALLGISRRSTGQEDNTRFKIACLMLEKGANIQATNNRGANPLQVCRSEKLRNAVQSAAQRVRPSLQRERTEEQLNELFSELPLPCMRCTQKLSDARLQPCNHKVLCQSCSMRVNRCPLCERPVTSRTDLRGNQIVEVPCKVQ